MPLVFLPEPLAFFLWKQEPSEAEPFASLLARRPTTLAEVIVPPGKRTVVVGCAVPLLDALPWLASQPPEALGASGAAWAAAARFAIDLVKREQVVPVMSEHEGGYEARWAVALVHEQERRFVRALAAAMPPSAHAVPMGSEGDEVWPAERLLRRLLDETADSLLRPAARVPPRPRSPAARVPPRPRSLAGSPSGPKQPPGQPTREGANPSQRAEGPLGDPPQRGRGAKNAPQGPDQRGRGAKNAPQGPQGAEGPLGDQDQRDWAQRNPQRGWVEGLTAEDRKLRGGLAERRAAEAIEAWSRPVLGDTERLRAAFRLEMPASEEGPFLLRFLLQDPDDPSFLLSADEIWDTDEREVQRLGRLLSDPQTALLRALYQAAQVLPALASALGQIAPTHIDLDPQQAWAFLGDGARALGAAGFSVLVPGELTSVGRRVRLQMDFDFFDKMADGLLPDNEPTLDEWLAFEWRVALGDETLSEGEFLALAQQKSPLVKHRGQWVVVDPTELPRIQERLKSRGGKARSRDALVAALAGETRAEGLRIKVRALGAFARLLDRLRGGEREAAAPAGLRTELRPYQRRGLGWLLTMSSLGLGACLADDMGLGKTVQLLALVLRRLESGKPPAGPALLVAPTSVLGNWEREIARFAPGLAARRHYGPGRATRPAQLTEGKPALVLTTYGMLWRDAELLGKVPWWMVAIDEAQNIKNSGTATAKAARSIDAPFRVALTGTPVENHLSELWSILDFLNPGLLGTEERFRVEHAAPVELGDAEAAAKLRRVVGPFVLRRMKTDPAIAPDLPAKEEMNVICTLTREQATLYKAAVDHMLDAIASAHGIARKGLVLALLTRLKQICNHPAQFLREAGPLPRRSGKLTRLTEMLDETLAEGDKALIFTQYQAMGSLLQRHLGKALSNEVLFLHGQTPRHERDRMVEAFQRADPSAPRLFVLSLKAGGTGLNLTAATQVFHFDRWWNPAVEDQATDRAYRIGQQRRVQVYKLVCAGTVEDKIDLMIRSKKELATRIIGAGESWITELGDEQLHELFSLSQGALVDEGG